MRMVVTGQIEQAKRLKSVLLQAAKVREFVADGYIKLKHISGTENPADALTKPQSGPRMQRLMAIVGLNISPKSGDVEVC